MTLRDYSIHLVLEGHRSPYVTARAFKLASPPSGIDDVRQPATTNSHPSWGRHYVQTSAVVGKRLSSKIVHRSQVQESRSLLWSQLLCSVFNYYIPLVVVYGLLLPILQPRVTARTVLHFPMQHLHSSKTLCEIPAQMIACHQ